MLGTVLGVAGRVVVGGATLRRAEPVDAEGREGLGGPEESWVLWVSDGWRKDVVRGGRVGSSLWWSCGCRKQLGPGCGLAWIA